MWDDDSKRTRFLHLSFFRYVCTDSKRRQQAVATCGGVPALLIHGAEDAFILPKHSKQIAKHYAGPCTLLTPKGDHNARRPASTLVAVRAFLLEVRACLSSARAQITNTPF